MNIQSILEKELSETTITYVLLVAVLIKKAYSYLREKKETPKTITKNV